MAKKQTWLFTFSARAVRKAREKTGMTQTQLAKKLKLQTPQYISNIERGLTRLSPKHFLTISKLTNTPQKRFIAAHLLADRARLKALVRGEL